ALGDIALEIEVFHRVILGADRQPLLADDQAWPAGHRPALERAVKLEPQIVMNPARVVLLHDELPALPLAVRRLGLGGAAEVAVLPVIRERGGFTARCRSSSFPPRCPDRPFRVPGRAAAGSAPE